MATIPELEKKIEKLEHELADLRSRVTDEPYALSKWEREEVRKGLSDSLATDAELQTVLAKYGLQNSL